MNPATKPGSSHALREEALSVFRDVDQGPRRPDDNLPNGALPGVPLGRIAMGLLDKADNTVTGGVLFNNSGSQTSSTSSTTGVALSPEIPVSYDSSAQAPVESVGATTGQVSISASAEDISKADSDYKAAYQNYLSATREGNAEKINAANKAYQEAFNNYKKLTGKEPQQ